MLASQGSQRVFNVLKSFALLLSLNEKKDTMAVSCSFDMLTQLNQETWQTTIFWHLNVLGRISCRPF